MGNTASHCGYTNNPEMFEFLVPAAGHSDTELQRMHDFYIDGVAPPSVCEAAMHPDDRTVIDRYLRMRMPDFYK